MLCYVNKFSIWNQNIKTFKYCSIVEQRTKFYCKIFNFQACKFLILVVARLSNIRILNLNTETQQPWLKSYSRGVAAACTPTYEFHYFTEPLSSESSHLHVKYLDPLIGSIKEQVSPVFCSAFGSCLQALLEGRIIVMSTHLHCRVLYVHILLQFSLL